MSAHAVVICRICETSWTVPAVPVAGEVPPRRWTKPAEPQRCACGMLCDVVGLCQEPIAVPVTPDQSDLFAEAMEGTLWEHEDP